MRSFRAGIVALVLITALGAAGDHGFARSASEACATIRDIPGVCRSFTTTSKSALPTELVFASYVLSTNNEADSTFNRLVEALPADVTKLGYQLPGDRAETYEV